MQAILRLHRHKYGVHDTGRMERLSVQVGEIFSSGVGGAVGRGSARARVWATSVDDVSLEDLMDSEIPLGQVCVCVCVPCITCSFTGASTV